jgi:hypothetical protein
MEWSGRALALPARVAWIGRLSTEHRHVQQIRSDRCHNGHRYWQEFIPRCGSRSAGYNRAPAEVITWPGGPTFVELIALQSLGIGVKPESLT